MTHTQRIIPFILLCLFALTGCQHMEELLESEPSTQEIISSEYTLGTGDILKIIVFGSEQLSGEFTVNSNGEVAFPLINNIKAQGLTRRELEEAIHDELDPDYIVDPKVSVEILQYRDVYVLGEVRTPGKYPYIPNMMAFHAVAVAGGYTYRANEASLELIRQVESSLVTEDVDPKTAIQPGDTIVVKRRWF